MSKLQGDALNKRIQEELVLIQTEGIVDEISATLVWKRLKSKGILNGEVSTLSTPVRIKMISDANMEYLASLGFSPREVSYYKSRNNKLALKENLERTKKENEDLKHRLAVNTHTLCAIIKLVKTNTTLKVDKLLSPYLIKQLKAFDKKENSDE